jgi:hypothetical protein
MEQQRLYTIRSDAGDRDPNSSYYPGLLPDGSPVLMRAGTHLYAVRFTPDGWLREVRMRCPDVCIKGAPPAENSRRWAKELFAWQEELGFVPGPIRVRHFNVTRPVEVRIEEYSGLALMALERDCTFTPEEAQEYLDDWHRTGKFVLHWDNGEYEMDGDGNPCG